MRPVMIPSLAELSSTRGESLPSRGVASKHIHLANKEITSAFTFKATRNIT